eukprot:TRINITY_DN12996_c0_g3_i1.p2 TRINITY_DN12996_c0_g3~~TRINITY_DN12996_c0_g3_i1.p2  ORF type:complete len:315 (+),score=62.90 TRINITY_DN12996_c0_g3_i1:98-946(+)
MATGVFGMRTLNDNWFEDRFQPEGGLSATANLHRKTPRAYETDLAYIGERYDVLGRISRCPPRASYAFPDDGFDEKGTTGLFDFADPRSRSDWGKGKALAPTMITTENAPVCPPETRELPGERSGFGAHIHRHGEQHGKSFFNTTMGDYYGEGSRQATPRRCPAMAEAAGVSTKEEEARVQGLRVGLLCGEAYCGSDNPACNTRMQRSWLYEADPALRNIHHGGTRRDVSKFDSELSLPMHEGAMSKVRADLQERKGRLYRTATVITKGRGHKAGVSIFQDE